MADAPRGGAAAGGARGGFGSRGDRGGDRGRGRGGRRGPRRGGNKSEEKEWQPVTKLGRLVKAGKIKSMEEIYLHSLPIKEYQIVDFFLPKLKDEVMKVRLDARASLLLSLNLWHQITDFEPINYRSSPSRSKHALVSVPGSRQSLLLATQKDTSVSASRHPKKLLQQSVQQSSLPSSASSPFEEGTGVLRSVTHIRCPPRRVGNVALLLSE